MTAALDDLPKKQFYFCQHIQLLIEHENLCEIADKKIFLQPGNGINTCSSYVCIGPFLKPFLKTKNYIARLSTRDASTSIFLLCFVKITPVLSLLFSVGGEVGRNSDGRGENKHSFLHQEAFYFMIF
jgi:hypothetical protein